MVRSFLLIREVVEIIRDWKAMGLKATATHSFGVPARWVHAKYSFQYNDIKLPHPIFKSDFQLFTDLTLWANYIGMAARYCEEGQEIGGPGDLDRLSARVAKADAKIMTLAQQIEDLGPAGAGSLPKEIHRQATGSVRALSSEIIRAHPKLGIRASRLDHPLNQAFRDFFTATQHHIFSQG